MTAMRQAGVRLWAKACESEEGRVVSLSAGSCWWLGRPKGPTVVTGSEEAADSAGGFLACFGRRSSLHPVLHDRILSRSEINGLKQMLNRVYDISLSTGIALPHTPSTAEAPCYDLSGRRINHPQHGCVPSQLF